MASFACLIAYNGNLKICQIMNSAASEEMGRCVLSPDLAMFSLSSRTRSLDFAMVLTRSAAFKILGSFSVQSLCGRSPGKGNRLVNMTKNGIIDYR